MKIIIFCLLALLLISATNSKRLLQNDLCQTWDASTNSCKQCYYHYWLDNGVCRQVNDLCATWNVNTGACTSCFYHYYLNNGQCYPVSDQCATWDPNTGKCTSCWSGGHLRDDGTCSCCAWNGSN